MNGIMKAEAGKPGMVSWLLFLGYVCEMEEATVTELAQYISSGPVPYVCGDHPAGCTAI